jgi:hypothetical protein
MPPGFTVNKGRWPFRDESDLDALGVGRLNDSLELPMLDAVLSSFAFVSMSYKASTVEEDGFGDLASFSGRARPLVGSTMSRNPSITKKRPKAT